MGQLFELRWLLLLIAIVNTGALQNPSTLPLDIQSQCLGNILRVDVGPLEGQRLDVMAVTNDTSIPLTSKVASKNGFSILYQMDSAVIYASIQNCFAHNVDDKEFTTVLQIRLYGNQVEEEEEDDYDDDDEEDEDEETYQVAETCSYSDWAATEILCTPNFVEVSVDKTVPENSILLKNSVEGPELQLDGSQQAAEVRLDEGFLISTLVFLTPEERVMTEIDAKRTGYGVGNTPSRLILRSSMNTHELMTKVKGGVPMTVLRASVIFEKNQFVTLIDAAAACPVMQGSVFFTQNMITWYLPRHIPALISSSRFKLLAVHVGINGMRLEPAELKARRVSLYGTARHIILEIPIGSAGGYFKSRVQNGQYYNTYTIEPMLELYWVEDTGKDMKYKVLLPITTPLLSPSLQVHDDTMPIEQKFKVRIGPFWSDSVIHKITFPFTGAVLSVEECNLRGFNVQEHWTPDGTSKMFTLEVPFKDRIVKKEKAGEMTVYSLHLTFTMLVLPDFSTFFVTGYLEAKLLGTVSPSITGNCDQQNFHVLVKSGAKGFDFKTLVGTSLLTPELAQQYRFKENGTHFSLTVPSSANDVVFVGMESSSIRSRIDISLHNLETQNPIADFSLACNFPLSFTECLPNGTMTTLAVKLESVPSLNTSQLTLRDPSCGPVYSDDHFAYFVFTGHSCGTTRTFSSSGMLYENEISLPDELEKLQAESTKEPEYVMKVSCLYDINTNQAVALHIRPRRNEPHAENGKGELQVDLRLFLDDSFSEFYNTEDYPLVKYLQQPLYFEVAMAGLTDPDVSLELENCWATLQNDKTSQPRWNLIINGCANPVDPYPVIFHPVLVDSRVKSPSHFKRFEIQMFAFAEDEQNLDRQLFVHCDVVVCDPRNPLADACNAQCSGPDKMKVQRRAADMPGLFHVSSGPIFTS